jgi:hypothetical protein
VLDNIKYTKTIVKYINLMGQQVSNDSDWLIFGVYDDGTVRKIIK